MHLVTFPAAAGCVLLFAGQVLAQVTTTGDVSPDPTTTTGSEDLYVGQTADGTMTIDTGSDVFVGRGYVGFDPGVSGYVSVTGAGSSWNVGAGLLYVGHDGFGVLDITDGGAVDSNGAYLGYHAGSTGLVAVDGDGSVLHASSIWIGHEGSGALLISNGGLVNTGASTWVGAENSYIHFTNGTLNTTTFGAGVDQLTGTGVVNTQGLVADWDVTFDQTHGPQQQFVLNALPLQNVTINLDQTSNGGLGAGFRGQGSLTIEDGVNVHTANAMIGFHAGSHGVVTVDDATWTVRVNGVVGTATVGREGHGELHVINRGRLYAITGHIGLLPGSTGVVTVDGPGSRWDSIDLADPMIYIGDEGHGTLNITNGGYVNSAQSYIGLLSGSTGVANVDGVGAKWDAGEFYVANRGHGTLNITNGGEVTSVTGLIAYESLSGSQPVGVVNVDGVDSTWTVTGDPYNSDNLYVGYIGDGTLNITDGGKVTNARGYIAFEAGSSGQVTVNGAGALWENAGALYVGEDGDGTMTIRNGGKVVSMGSGLIGESFGSSGRVTVDGEGSMWTMNGSPNDLYVGRNGDGWLTISNGGVVTNTHVFANYRLGTTSQIIVEGAGSLWDNAGTLHLGVLGSATLLISDGGRVNSDEGHVGWGTTNPYSELTVEGNNASWIVNRYINVATNGEGVLNINEGGLVQVGHYLRLGDKSTSKATVNLAGGTLDLTGNNIILSAGTNAFTFTGGWLQNVNSMNFDLYQQGGTFAIGSPVGITSVVGNYSQLVDATLAVELADAGSHDQLTVTGDVSLAGTLSVDLLNGFTPTPGSNFVILTGNTVAGTFQAVTGLPIDGDVMLGLLYDAASVTLQTALAGDYNGDGFVGQDDLSILLTYWGQQVTAGKLLNGDASGDGFVGQDDLNLVLAYWGEGEPPSFVPVPEPGAAAVVLAGLLLRGYRRRGGSGR